MKPALTTLGKTSTHSALPSKSRGIPLSGVPMISLRTVDALFAWLAPSFVFDPRRGGFADEAVDFGLLRCAVAMTEAAKINPSNAIVWMCFLFISLLCHISDWYEWRHAAGRLTHSSHR